MASISLGRLAACKGLDAARISRDFGVTDTTYHGQQAVSIPYRDGAGCDLFEKLRLADGSARYRPSGIVLNAYGLDRLAQTATGPDPIFLVEGESDVWCLSEHGFTALGIPGASSFRTVWTPAVASLVANRPVVLWEEPDQGGTSLVVDVARKVPGAIVIRGTNDGCKDACDLLRSVGAAAFPDLLREQIATATPIAKRANDILARRPATIRNIRSVRRAAGNSVDQDVARARNVSTIAWLEGQGHRLSGRGQNRQCRCPFSDHPDPRASFSASSGPWFCFGCQRKGGDAIDLARQLHGASFADAVRMVVAS